MAPSIPTLALHRIPRRAPSGIAARISPRRWPIAASATPRAIPPLRWTTAKIRRRCHRRLARLQHHPRQGTGIGAWSDEEVFAYLAKGHAAGRGTASGPMGEAVDHSFSQMEPADIRSLVTYLRSIPAVASSDAGDDRAAGVRLAERRRRSRPMRSASKVFEQACASCHSWTGVSTISPFATITGSRAVNDPTATNVAQIVISGTRREDAWRIIDAGLWQHVFRHGDRGSRELRHWPVRQHTVQARSKGRS